MGDYITQNFVRYDGTGNVIARNESTDWSQSSLGTFTHSEFTSGPDDQFTANENTDVSGNTWIPGTDHRWMGTTVIGGNRFHVFQFQFTTDEYYVYSTSPDSNYPNGISDWPSSFDLSALDTSDFAFCFAQGTEIATSSGRVKVEDLAIGDTVLTQSCQSVPVKWIGRQTVHRFAAQERMQPVRIRAGALGVGLPHSDLTVTADHGMILDGMVINASALVNGTTIDWVPMAELPDQVTYYHIETEAHDVILANGAPAETFIDVAGRQAFDNYREYLDLYGAERIIPEMKQRRITTRRLLPHSIKDRLGITETVDGLDLSLSA